MSFASDSPVPRGEAFVLFELEGILVVLLRVLGLFGHREIGELGREHVGAERSGDVFLERVQVVQVGRENHEAEVGAGEHRDGDDLGLGLLPGHGDQGIEMIEGQDAILVGLGAPGRKVDAVKKMERAEAFLGTGAGRWEFRMKRRRGALLQCR